MFTAGADPWPGLICVDKAARRSPPSLPPSRTPSCVVNNSKCQSQADVTCAFLKKKNLSPLIVWRVESLIWGKKPGRERWPYVAREGSVFPAEELQNVVHARYARHVHRLCACRTIKQRSSLCPEVKQYPDPRWQLCLTGPCEQCVATGYLPVSSWHGSYGCRRCHRTSAAGGDGIFMTSEMSRRHERRASAQWDCGGWTETGALSCWPGSPVHTKHSDFIITKEGDTKFNQGSKFSRLLPPEGRDSPETASLKDKILSTDV